MKNNTKDKNEVNYMEDNIKRNLLANKLPRPKDIIKDATIGPKVRSFSIPFAENSKDSEKLKSYIQSIQVHLIQNHATLLCWFDKEEDLRNYKPEDEGWSIKEILEHISLTSHYLLILISKGFKKACKNIDNLSLEELIENFNCDLTKFDNIGIHKSFNWIRPEHMEPKGEISESENIRVLNNQLTQCLNYLSYLSGGAGLLYKTMMTVDNLGKLNVYEYIFFLSKHIERHIQQMKENEEEYIRIVKEK